MIQSEDLTAHAVDKSHTEVQNVVIDSSGDIFIAFSTANSGAASRNRNVKLEMLPNDRMDPLFEATIQATEEAILNALVAAETMTGINGNTAHALPRDRLREVLRKYNRLVE